MVEEKEKDVIDEFMEDGIEESPEDKEEEVHEAEEAIEEEKAEDKKEEAPAEEEKAEEKEVDLEEEEKPKKPKRGRRAEKKKEPEFVEPVPGEKKPTLFALRTTANREDQVMDFVVSNAQKKGLEVYSIIRPHGMRGYIFMEAGSRTDAEQAAFNVPYARGILSKIIEYREIEHMLEQVKKEVNIRKNDIAEIISGPFKREQCKITRIDKTKEEVVVELLDAAVPIPITVKMDAVKVIRRESEEPEEEDEKRE
jgi:transcription termination/antitermination protein NusG